MLSAALSLGQQLQPEPFDDDALFTTANPLFAALLPMVQDKACERRSSDAVSRFLTSHTNGSLYNGAASADYRLADILFGAGDGCKLRENISATFPGSLAARCQPSRAAQTLKHTASRSEPRPFI